MASPNTKRDKSKEYSDLYNTPDIALDKLMDFADLNKYQNILEPCNGIGKISNYLKNLGYHIYTNELYDYGSSDFSDDFLAPLDEVTYNIKNYDVIVTNPPYKLAKEFVLRGFEIAREQYLLLRLSFLEGQKRYQELFSKKHLKGVYIFTARISCSEGVDELPTANSVTYCWLHFESQNQSMICFFLFQKNQLNFAEQIAEF